jgi:TPR repeat protein
MLFMPMALLTAQTWPSTAPWKSALLMNDPHYRPVPPLFVLMQPAGLNGTQIFGDLLTLTPSESSFGASAAVRALNERNNTDRVFSKIEQACAKGVAQACLILGRIYEFGSYNKTQDHTRALDYYLRVEQLNSPIAYSALSFYHRYGFPDVPRSVLEGDLSVQAVESALSAGLQHQTGFLRPLSCPMAARLVEPVAEAVAEMNMIPGLRPANASELAALRNSTDPTDLHRLALLELSVPYPSIAERRRACKLLRRALRGGHEASASMLAVLLRSRDKPDLQKIFDVLAPAVRFKDPVGLLVKAELHLHRDIPGLFDEARAIGHIKTAASTGFAPAVHALAFITYYGFCGVTRSNVAAFRLFKQAAATGYRPSMLAAAKLLITGDGAPADCPEGLAMLKRITDAGPWVHFFELYGGDPHAFQKMLDINQTPREWIEIDAKAETTAELLRISGRALSLLSSSGMRKLREADEGRPAALLWLTLKTPIEEAVGWLARVELLAPIIAVLAVPLRWWLIAKGLWGLVAGRLTPRQAAVLKGLIRPLCDGALVVTVTVCLLCLIALRINATFE